MSFIVITGLLLMIMALGSWRREAERLDQSVDDIDLVYDPNAQAPREPPSV